MTPDPYDQAKRYLGFVDYARRRRDQGASDDEIFDEVRQAFTCRASDGSDGAESVHLKKWPDPVGLPDELPPVLGFDFELLPTSFRDFVKDVSERMQCPPEYPAVGSMVGLASIVGRKVAILPKRMDDWKVVPNLWGMVVGRPSLSKSPALEQALRPIHLLEDRERRAHEKRIVEHEAEVMAHRAVKRAAEDRLRREAKNGAEGLLEIARAAIQDMPEEPERRRLVTNDATVEKLGELLAVNRNGLLSFRDELIGLLRSLDKEGQEAARAFYLEAWAGKGRFTYDRIGRGTVEIEAATLSLLGCITPGPLTGYLRAACDGGKGDDGLMQRFQLSVWPDYVRRFTNVDRPPDKGAWELYFGVFQRLHALEPGAIGDCDADGIPFVRFASEAQRTFDGWREVLEARVRSCEDHPAFEAHLVKYRSLIPSLALLIHLADDGVGPVDSESLDRAVRWGEFLECHARRIYAIGTATPSVSARALAQKILGRRVDSGFSLRDVYVQGWSGLKEKHTVDAAANFLVELDWLEKERVETNGRPKTVFWVNPKVYERPGVAPANPTEGASVGFVGAGLDRSQKAAG